MPRICFETGTYRGDSTEVLAASFEEVHTIELSKTWHEFAKRRFASNSRIFCHHGDSAAVLESLLPEIREPAAFFLDAHFAGGNTALGIDEVPLLRELQAICGRSQPDIIIVDDLRLMGKTGQTGCDGDPIYPRMTFDWRDISTRRIRHIAGKGLRNVWMTWWDKLVIFRNQSLAQGAVLAAAALPVSTLDVPLRAARALGKRAIGSFRKQSG